LYYTASNASAVHLPSDVSAISVRNGRFGTKQTITPQPHKATLYFLGGSLQPQKQEKPVLKTTPGRAAL